MNVLNPYKILMYSHDTYGLGHIRRCLAIAEGLRKSPSNILIITGSLLAGRFKIPQRTDFVRIPGMIKVKNEQYLPLSMKLDSDDVLELRKSIILATAKAFRPDFFIVDKAPLGLKREVVDTLQWLRSDFRSCTVILGLRDIMDSARATIQEWREKSIYDAMDDLYDEIWVYGCRAFYDPIREYEMPLELSRKVHFTGYIPRRIPTPEKIRITRHALGIADDERMILVTTGGGGDGYPMVKSFLEAFHPGNGGLPPKTRAVIVTGPFVSPKEYEDVARMCHPPGFLTLKFYRYMERLIGAAQVVVSMGGYNTVCEVASQRRPFLIVPRTDPREEQLIRAKVLCSQGYCEYIDPRDASPHNLRIKVQKLLEYDGARLQSLADFPFMASDTIAKRIFENKRSNRK